MVEDIKLQIYGHAKKICNFIEKLDIGHHQKQIVSYWVVINVAQRQNMVDHMTLRRNIPRDNVPSDTINTLIRITNDLESLIEKNYQQNHNTRYAVRWLAIAIICGIEMTEKDVPLIFPSPDAKEI